MPVSSRGVKRTRHGRGIQAEVTSDAPAEEQTSADGDSLTNAYELSLSHANILCPAYMPARVCSYCHWQIILQPEFSNIQLPCWAGDSAEGGNDEALIRREANLETRALRRLRDTAYHSGKHIFALCILGYLLL